MGGSPAISARLRRKRAIEDSRPSPVPSVDPTAYLTDPGVEVVALPEWFTYNFASAGPQDRMVAGSLLEDGNSMGRSG